MTPSPDVGCDVGEPAVAVVAQQRRAGRTGGVAGPAGDEQIEVAVVIGVEPGGRRWRAGRWTESGRR